MTTAAALEVSLGAFYASGGLIPAATRPGLDAGTAFAEPPSHAAEPLRQVADDPRDLL